MDLEIFGQLDELDMVEAAVLTPLPVGLHRGQAVHVDALVHLPNEIMLRDGGMFGDQQSENTC